jgi:hypothetical protein
MTTFGIIAEGITDQKVIENILLGYFGSESEEPVVNYVQPPNDKTSRGSTPAPGGWTLVFAHLEGRAHLNNLQFNDYLVIHIDTDVCEDVGFGVPRKENGIELSAKELMRRVSERLKSVIGAEDYAHYGHRILFAIAVHGIECWLMPLFFPNNSKAGKIAGCLSAANHALKNSNEAALSKTDGSDKSPTAYENASRPYKSRKTLMKLHDKNPSLDAFVKQLELVEKTSDSQTTPATAPP